MEIKMKMYALVLSTVLAASVAGTAQAAVTSLLGSGYLAQRDQGLSVVDPLFADWIRRRFP